MSERQRGLGRGLSALLGENVAESAPVNADAPQPTGVRSVPIETLKPNPDQPRKQFSADSLEELTNSIRDKGVLQPILVREQPGQKGIWQIIAGERRWRAAQAARLRTVPVIERPMNDVEVMEVAIIENVQRSDLNPVEEALAYGSLMSRFGRTQDALAAVVGKSRSHVANTIRLLQLPEPVLNHVMENRLTAGHARALITAPDPEAMAAQVLSKGLNVRQTEALVRKAIDGPKKGKSKSGASDEGAADVAALAQDLADALGLKVGLADKGGKGEVTIKYSSLEQLDDLCRRLMRG